MDVSNKGPSSGSYHSHYQLSNDGSALDHIELTYRDVTVYAERKIEFKVWKHLII